MKIFSLLIVLMFIVFSCNNNSPTTPSGNEYDAEYKIFVDYNDDGIFDYNRVVFPGYEVNFNFQNLENNYVYMKIVTLDESEEIATLKIRIN